VFPILKTKTLAILHIVERKLQSMGIVLGSYETIVSHKIKSHIWHINSGTPLSRVQCELYYGLNDQTLDKCRQIIFEETR
jgi:hypothetical protein